MQKKLLIVQKYFNLSYESLFTFVYGMNIILYIYCLTLKNTYCSLSIMITGNTSIIFTQNNFIPLRFCKY